jgi:hypothetical protein
MKIHKEMLQRWEKYSRLILKEKGKNVDDIKSKIEAWAIARELSIPVEAYHAGYNSKELENGLKLIFTNAFD